MFATSILAMTLTMPLAQAGDAKALVEKQVNAWKGDGATVRVVDAKVLGEVFPKHTFVAVHFPLWPVARAAPEPMKSQNLFAVSKEGKVTHLPDSRALENWFGTTLANIADPSAVAQSWLLLRSEYLQDGYYKFKQPEKVAPVGAFVMGVVEVVPEMGNSGSLKAVIQFGKSEKFRLVSEENKIMRGMRPRCQATLLLHPEKLVREIAEQDLLVMGRSARGYLMEQRAKASDELRREIDRVWRQIEAEGR